ncbi:MAG TPA: cbb3-type cytochrome c oxidase subunit I, partial [Telluria sp.]|nr:cbb3-type cytochrome c oxidase subunit I [Telluria sp.]
GTGLVGWVRALPWSEPAMLAVAFSFVMLGFGGAGGIINMSYQLDFAVHNTQWITGHFHLIFGGAIGIMYFALAYDLWPHLTGKQLLNSGMMKAQLWLWFIGMLVLTFPWHVVGIMGMPRRMAYFDYSNPEIAPQAITVVMSAVGGLLLVISGLLLLLVLFGGHRSAKITLPEFRFSQPVHPVTRLPAALNGYALWLALMVGLSIVNYGYPIGQLIGLKQTSVPAVPVGGHP